MAEYHTPNLVFLPIFAKEPCMAHRHSLRFTAPHPNPPPPNNARRAHTMRAPLPLPLKLIFPPNITTRILCLSNSMADKPGAISATETLPIEAAKNAEQEQKPPPEKSELPPPPEKPEPGDCCGSGCVRCVWDVYYDELEEYNKLYKSDSSSKI